MKKEIIKEIEIPEGIHAELDRDQIVVKGKGGEIRRNFPKEKVSLEIKSGKVIISSKNATKKEKKIINTNAAHIKNMIKGVEEPFEYKLKICFNHFPISVEIKGNEAIVKNFLGEKVPRKVSLPKGIEIKMDKDIITITSPNKELAGQAAANLERVTKIKLRDRRIFQDGIFMITKAGRAV